MLLPIFIYHFSGLWAKALKDAIEKCCPGCKRKRNKGGKKAAENVQDTASELYQALSGDIQGQPWSGDAVQLDDSLSPLHKCIMTNLCKHMGLIVDKPE